MRAPWVSVACKRMSQTQKRTIADARSTRARRHERGNTVQFDDPRSSQWSAQNWRKIDRQIASNSPVMEDKSMLALVNTASGSAPIELREVPEPNPARNEALVEVHAFSLNRGELSSFARNEEGWVPGQDIAGVVLRPAANGKGPPAGARVVALVDAAVGRSALRCLVAVWQYCRRVLVFRRRPLCRWPG
jgi:hypothetical protein